MDKQTLLTQIENSIKICRKCRLCEKATNAVPGEGNINSELVFIGEAPGEYEDKSGRPFVGRAGKLLEALLAEIGYKRSDIWIGNIIKHRPPENRDPMPDEIAACEPYLTEQLRIIAPKLIVTLGRFSMYYFYKDGKISRDRGTPIPIGNYMVYPVFHPAAALRNPEMARGLKEDFMRIPQVLADIKSGKISARPSSSVTNNRTKPPEVLEGQVGLGI